MTGAASLLLALLLAAPVLGAEGDAALLPEVSLRLKAARYAPGEPDFEWDGWLGAGAGLLRVGPTTLYATADIETVIGSVKRTFDPNQSNYHLEPGLRTPIGRVEVTVFFHHVSRHYVDRPKIQAVDWNVLGVRAQAPLPAAFPFAGRAALGVGHTTEVSLVGYRWEMTGRLEADVFTRPWGGVYAVADLRGVTAHGSPQFPRKGFLDAAVEAGLRFRRSGSLDLFAAWEHRNDVYLETPGFRDRALFGLRIGYSTSSGR